MDRLNNEIWEKWSILGEKNLSHDMDKIILDENGLFIKLYNIGSVKEKDIIIKFNSFVSYKITDNYYKEADLQDLIDRNAFNGSWGAYIVKNSIWIKKLLNSFYDKPKYVHYVIIEEDVFIEIISSVKPQVKFVEEK